MNDQKIISKGNGVNLILSDDNYPIWERGTASCEGMHVENGVYQLRNLVMGNTEDATALLSEIATIRKQAGDTDIYVWLNMEAYEKPEMAYMQPSPICPWDEGFEEALAEAGFTDKRQYLDGDWHVHYAG